ncbi:prepilin peptidase [Corynebacterium mustelae]|nr:prepilin peptidase [Corynebacterium mustelae]
MVVGFYVTCFVWALVLTWWDLRYYQLPNLLVVPAIIFLWMLAVSTERLDSVVGGLVWSGLYALSRLIAIRLRGVSAGGIGGGDIKLALVTGTLIGNSALAPVFAAVLLAQLLSIVYAFFLKRNAMPTPLNSHNASKKDFHVTSTQSLMTNKQPVNGTGRMRDVKVPHGPAMLLATAVVLVLCPEARIFSP